MKEIKDTGSLATHVAKVCIALCPPDLKQNKTKIKKAKTKTFTTQKPNSMFLNVWVEKKNTKKI